MVGECVRFLFTSCDIKFEKVDCFVNLIIVMLSNQSQNTVLLAFCTSLEKTTSTSWIANFGD